MKLHHLMSLFPYQRVVPIARFMACWTMALFAFAEIREVDSIVSLEAGI